MGNRIKLPLVSLLLFCSFASFAQKDSLVVNRNKDKIDQLNQRLDRLLSEEPEGDEKKDSTVYKIDFLFKEIREIKVELNELKSAVKELRKVDVATQKNEQLTDKLSNQLAVNSSSAVADDLYYIVILSDRTEEGAIQKRELISTDLGVKLIQNEKKTWFHWVLEKTFSIDEVGNQTQKYRDLGYQDAWWTIANKLRE